MVFTAFRTHFARKNQHFLADRQLVTKKEIGIEMNLKMSVNVHGQVD